MTIIFIAFAVLVLLLVVVLSVSIIIPIVSGAPYFRTHESAREVMFELADVRAGETVVDLGAGDGVLVLEAVSRGAYGVGYEINPFLVFRSLRSARSGGHLFAEFYFKSLWKADVSDADVVFLFGIPKMMKPLEHKLRRELKPGARVVSFTFSFPTWQPSVVKDNVRLYVNEVRGDLPRFEPDVRVSLSD